MQSLRDAIAVLVERGYVRPLGQARARPAGRPASPMYLVNPQALGRHPHNPQNDRTSSSREATTRRSDDPVDTATSEPGVNRGVDAMGDELDSLKEVTTIEHQHD
jgi:hypothetical protein